MSQDEKNAEALAQAAQALADADAPTPEPDAATPAQASPRERALAQVRAKAAEAPRFTPDADVEWVRTTTGGEIARCNSRPNARGESFLYLVYRVRGREVAIPLAAIYEALDAEQF